MSFTAEVKDELSRSELKRVEAMVQLAAMVRFCGSLSVESQRRYCVSMTTETGVVARNIIQFFISVYGIKPRFTVRRSVLHKAHNYLIQVRDEPKINAVLVQLGILTPEGGLYHGIDPRLTTRGETARAYLRGAFMAVGSLSEPSAEAHFELVVQDEDVANDLVSLFARFGIEAHLGRRRNQWIVYLKNTQEIQDFLALVGAPGAMLRLEQARDIKLLRNETNRLINAEMANQTRASSAAADQYELVTRVAREIGLEKLPAGLRDFCELRIANPTLSLRELGEASDPPLSKSAVYHRVRRLTELLEDSTKGGGTASD